MTAPAAKKRTTRKVGRGPYHTRCRTCLEEFTTANLDFIQHYRPTQNVLKRPTQNSGQSIALTGHHEIMVPLLAAALKGSL